MMHWGNYGTYGWGMGLGWIWMLLVWGMIIGGVAYVIKTTTQKNGASNVSEIPIDVLKKRYAEGEISKEEYERMKNHLVTS
jgi:putative membrane protein